MDIYNKSIVHPFGTTKSVTPFIWDYNNMLEEFKTSNINIKSKEYFLNLNISKIGKNEIIELDDNTVFLEQTHTITVPLNCIYLGYHNWCYYYDTFNEELNVTKKLYYTMDCSIHTLDDNIINSPYYPYKISKNNKMIPGGVPFNKQSENRYCSIHNIDDIPRYSPQYNNCFLTNFLKNNSYNNTEFVSIGKNFNREIKKYNNKTTIIKSIAPNIVVHHKLEFKF